MTKQKINSIIGLTTIVVLITIGIQFYWNYENYRTNEQLLLNEIKHSFDEAVDYHYDNTSKNSYMTFIDNESDSISEPDILLDFMGNSEFVNYLKQIDTTKNEFETLEDQEPFPENTSIELVRGKNPKETQDVLD
ncbi:MAG: hypothetical protein KJO63_07440, partial [Maribacter sp.]|nr:hypothetical protein [Maribacter sp.]